MQHHLSQEVDGVAEVRAPAHVDEALLLGRHDLFHDGGNVGVDVQHDEVIAKAVGEALLEHGGGVQSGGGAGQDVVVAVDGERDADGAQLVHGLLLQGVGVVLAAHTDHGLAVVSFIAEAQLAGHQGGVVSAVGGVAQAFHGVEVVLALQGVDLVVACVEGAQLQVLVEALAESLVGHGLVPVLIRGAVRVVAGVVEDEAVAELLGALLAQLAVVLVVGVVGDGGQGGLHQIDLVQLAVLVQLVADVHIAQHGHGETLKAAHVVGAVVAGVGNVALGVALNILLHDVGTAVPHGGVVAGAEALDAQLVDQVLSSRVEAVVGDHGIEIGAGVGAGEHQSVIIRCFHADAEAQHILVG